MCLDTSPKHRSPIYSASANTSITTNCSKLARAISSLQGTYRGHEVLACSQSSLLGLLGALGRGQGVQVEPEGTNLVAQLLTGSSPAMQPDCLCQTWKVPFHKPDIEPRLFAKRSNASNHSNMWAPHCPDAFGFYCQLMSDYSSQPSFISPAGGLMKKQLILLSWFAILPSNTWQYLQLQFLFLHDRECRNKNSISLCH